MATRLTDVYEKRPRLIAILTGVAGSIAGYVLCYLLGLLLLATLIDSTSQSEIASALLQVREFPFFVVNLVCGWPIFLFAGLLIGLPLNELCTHYKWRARTMLIWDFLLSGALGAFVCGPWNAFALFAILAYGE